MPLKIRSLNRNQQGEPIPFRRCQTKFPPEGLVVADGKFTPDQVKVLKAEKMLVVESVSEPIPEKSKK